MSPPAVKDIVEYRAFAGDRWQAVVMAVRPAGFVDLDVIVPGCQDRVALHAVRWSDGPAPCAGWPEAGR